MDGGLGPWGYVDQYCLHRSSQNAKQQGHLYTYMYAVQHTNLMQRNARTYTHTCTQITHIYTHKPHTYTHKPHTHTHKHKHTYTHKQMRIYTHTHPCTHTHSHSHMCTHISQTYVHIYSTPVCCMLYRQAKARDLLMAMLTA